MDLLRFFNASSKNMYNEAQIGCFGEMEKFGEIDPCSQFHQHFTSSFFADILSTKNYKAKL